MNYDNNIFNNIDEKKNKLKTKNYLVDDKITGLKKIKIDKTYKNVISN